MKKILSQSKFSPEQLAAIGAVAAESAYIDYLLGEAIKCICDLSDAQFRALAGDKQIAARITLFEELALIALEGNDAARDELTRVLKNALISHPATINCN
jgi:hypothetical protein